MAGLGLAVFWAAPWRNVPCAALRASNRAVAGARSTIPPWHRFGGVRYIGFALGILPVADTLSYLAEAQQG